MKTLTISNFSELVTFINDSEELSNADLNAVLMNTVRGIMTEDHTKQETIQILTDYWSVYGNRTERPIFIDIGSMDVPEL